MRTRTTKNLKDYPKTTVCCIVVVNKFKLGIFLMSTREKVIWSVTGIATASLSLSHILQGRRAVTVMIIPKVGTASYTSARLFGPRNFDCFNTKTRVLQRMIKRRSTHFRGASTEGLGWRHC